MIVNLVFNDVLKTLVLPKRVAGQFWMQNTRQKNYVCIEGADGEWHLKAQASQMIRTVDQNGGTLSGEESVLLDADRLYIIDSTRSLEDRAFAFCEDDSPDRNQFRLYSIPENFDVTVGSGKGPCVLSFSNDFVSTRHAQLSYRSGSWSLQDTESKNGTFVNCVRQRECDLQYGDMIFIMGMKIIVGLQCFAVNCPDGKVEIHSPEVTLTKLKSFTPAEDDSLPQEVRPEFFDRSPRFKRDIVPAAIQVDSPPNAAQTEEMPLALTVGPAMTMAMASMTSGAFAVTNAISNGNITAAVPTIAMSASMCLGSLLWPTLTRRYQKKQRVKKEAERKEKYTEYLEHKREEIAQTCAAQEEILRENNIPPEECSERILKVQRNLWERSSRQNDFMNLRIGIGDIPMSGGLSYAQRHFSVTSDALCDSMLELCETPQILHQVPITISLLNTSVGIIGAKAVNHEFVKGLILQLAALYSYDELKLVLLYDEEDEETFGFVKWLPHVWNQEGSFRLIAANAAQAKDVEAYLERVVSVRTGMSASELEDAQPYYLVITASKSNFDRVQCLRTVLESKNGLHMSVMTAFQEFRHLPKECTRVIELGDDITTGKLYDKDDTAVNTVLFTPDQPPSASAMELSTKLANIMLDHADQSASLPKLITFLQLMQAGKAEHLNALLRWKENDPTKSLAAPVGCNAFGDLFVLDLHEKAHGPHGLIAGMTGSGKSEFIITYILSLAVNYHPEEVSFILIDYKGGGMAKSFENLPHTAGIITNLDGSAIKRSLVSINSELKRRQTILAQASKLIDESNINIYQYQKLYREGRVTEPLSHLFIIADEFAELKTQQSDFMTELISAARIGRSLGVHLILATQKPSGVVDDQIWSNSRFRVCLKVQEKQDSMDMLKRPDAAELADTGRFYLQVGYNELFELGQSAWAGADYIPSDRVLTEKDNSVEAIDLNGHVIRSVKPSRAGALPTGKRKKQLDIITQYLSEIAAEEQIHARALWLAPLPEMRGLDALREKYAADYARTEIPFVLEPAVGEFDDPANQKQGLMTLPISAEGNTVIYGAAGAGKALFLSTMLYSLMTTHTPAEVNFYLLDFGDETLKAFSGAPHTGEVLLSGDGEKIARLFKMLNQQIRRRKSRLSARGTDYLTYMRQHPETEDMPALLIVIHNYAAFIELFEAHEDDVAYLSREGVKYGIYFILTSMTSNGVRFRITQNFKQHITLQMNDESDYSVVMGKTEGLFPARMQGRGLCRMESILEFQTAHISETDSEFEAVQKKCAELRASWQGVFAAAIPILPDVVDTEFLLPHYRTDRIWNVPVGVNKSTLALQYYDFGVRGVDLIASADNSCMLAAEGLLRLFNTVPQLQITVFDIGNKLGENIPEPDGERLCLLRTETECRDGLLRLGKLASARCRACEDTAENKEEAPQFEPVLCLVADLKALFETLAINKEQRKAENSEKPTDDERLSVLLTQTQRQFNLHFVIADNTRNISKYSHTDWFKDNCQNNGIWVGGGASEQYYLVATESVPSMRQTIKAPMGYVYTNGRPVLCKLLAEVVEEGSDDEVSG